MKLRCLYKESSLNEEVLKVGKDKNDILTFGTQSEQFTIATTNMKALVT